MQCKVFHLMPYQYLPRATTASNALEIVTLIRSTSIFLDCHLNPSPLGP